MALGKTGWWAVIGLLVGVGADLPTARGQSPLLDDSIAHRPLGKFATVFHDPTGRAQVTAVLARDDLSFKPHDKRGFNFGLQRGAWWIRIALENTDTVSRPLIIELINPNIHEASFYTVAQGTVTDSLHGGTAFPFRHRAIQHQNLLYPIVVPAMSESVCYIRVASPMHSLNFNLLLWDQDLRTAYSLYESRFIDYFFFLNTTFLIILGIVLWMTRQRRQWTFFVYVLIGILYSYSDIGLAFKNLWPDAPRVQHIANFLLTNLYLIAGLSFFREYFTTWRLIPRVDRVVRGLMIASVGFAGIALGYQWLPSALTAIALGSNAVLFALTGMVVVYVLVILLLRLRRKTETVWFLIGFSLHAVSILIACLRQLGLYNNGTALGFADWYPIFIWTTHTQNIMFWAMLWEILVVFSLMLYRFKVLYEDNNRMLVELADQREENTRVLLTGIERERQRIAQDLHDGSGVQLAAIRMKLTLLDEQLETPEKKAKLQAVMTDLDNAQHEIRAISHNLMPKTLSKLGLIPALDELVNKLNSADPSVRISFFRQFDAKRFSETARVNSYRIVQELLSNAIKHAGASMISLQLIQDNQSLVISIEDDGRGFDTAEISASPGIGLQNIQSRATLMGGEVRIDSGKEKGTFISVSLPLDWINKGSD